MTRVRSTGRATSAGDCCGTDCCGAESTCCGLPGIDACRVEAVVNVDARGQMVLPKDVRVKAGFAPDQKLAVVSWTRGDDVCCVTLLKAGELENAVRRAYGPLLADLGR